MVAGVTADVVALACGTSPVIDIATAPATTNSTDRFMVRERLGLYMYSRSSSSTFDVLFRPQSRGSSNGLAGDDTFVDK